MMISPSDLNLLELPWLPLEEKSAFPNQPAIYFAIDTLGNAQYIGRSVDPRQRWQNHHRFNQLRKLGSIKIAYLFVDAPELLPEIEAALIEWLKPPLNIVNEAERIEARGKLRASASGKTKMPMKIRRIIKQEIDVPDLGKRIKEAREASNRTVTELAKSVGISRNYWYQLEAEAVLGGMAEDTLRKIEATLGVSFNVSFEEVS